MSQWQTLTPLQTQPLYLSLHNGSQETLEADDLISPELPPQSPVFDFDEFLNDSSSSKVSQSHQMSDTASVSTQLAVQRDNGSLGPWPTWDQTTVFHEETLNALQPSPSSFPQSASAINLSSSTMAPTSSFTHYPSFNSQQSIPFKFQDAQVASPQSILSTVYEARAQFPPSQSAPYQPPSASFSDYELGITGSVIGMENNNDLFQLGKMDDQQMQLNYHEIGRLPYGDSGYAGAHQSMYAPQSIHQSVSAEGRTGQRRVLVPRRDSSVPPYATDYRSSQSKAVFVASAPTPSMLSDISSLSPGSPRSVQGGISIPGSSPSITSVSPRYITPTSPTMAAQFSASPAQFSASPHQFVGASPAFIDPSPITFVNQTAQYSTSARSDEPTLSSAPESAGLKMFNPAKRRRPATSDGEEDSDEKRNEDVPTKSELRPPKQAPSMWQIYFADWLQDHKTRHPHDKLNVAQAAKEAGQLYKTLDEEMKEDLKRRVYLEKEVRERRLQAWQRTLTPEDIKRENRYRAAQRKAGLSRRANIKDPNAPKKPLSAYFMFLARIRSDPALVQEVFGDETETTRQSVLAARRWREMSDEEKKPFLTQAEHDKIQYEALRKIYEEQAAGASGSDSSRSANRKQMTGTGYIVPQQIHFSEDITAAIISARPSISEPDDIRMISYDPEATITARKPSNKVAPIPIFSSIGPIRRRVTRKASRTRHSLGDSTTRSSSTTDDARGGSDSGVESPESDDEWVPGKSI